MYVAFEINVLCYLLILSLENITDSKRSSMRYSLYCCECLCVIHRVWTVCNYTCSSCVTLLLGSCGSGCNSEIIF
jgi:hypothetical protein